MTDREKDLRLEDTADYLPSSNPFRNYHISEGRLCRGEQDEQVEQVDIYERPEVKSALMRGERIILGRIRMPSRV